MGYCITMKDCTLTIKKENMKPLIENVLSYLKDKKLRWVYIDKSIKDINFNEEKEDESFCYDCTLDISCDECQYNKTSIYQLWEDFRYEIVFKNGVFKITEFLGEKLGDDDIFFELIAPFTEDGYIEFLGEDGDRFRYVIEDNKMKEVFAKCVWEEK